MVTTQTEVKRNLVAEAAEDFLGFWLVLAFVHDALGVREKPSDRELTLEIVRELLAEDLLVPGFPIDQGPEFDAWDLPVEEAMARFEQAWDELNDDPFTNDIAWFIATPKGKEWLKSQATEAQSRNEEPIEEKSRFV